MWIRVNSARAGCRRRHSDKYLQSEGGACDERTYADGVIPVGASGVAGVTVAPPLRNRHDRHVVRGCDG